MKNIFEVIVVGAGPVGCYLSTLLGKANVNVALIDQRKVVGEPVQCAGLITPRVFSRFHIPMKGIVQQTIKGAHIIAPDNTTLSIGGTKTHAYSIDRRAFDQYLASQAQNYSVTLFNNQKVIQVKKESQKISVKTNNNHTFSAPLIIGADGPHSIIQSTFNFPKPSEFLRGIGAELTNVEIEPDVVKLFIGNKIAPGFFAWVIPTNKTGTTARIGLCVLSSKAIKTYFNRFFSKIEKTPSMQHAKITRYIGGTIPIGMLKQIVMDQVMLVGDSAAQVKPTSGGGIYPGMCCASFCADTIIQAINKQSFSKNVLSSYSKKVKRDIGKELARGMLVRKAFTHLSDDDFNKYIMQMNQPKIIETINKYGDIDYPSRLFAPLLMKAPSLLLAIKHYSQ